MNMESWWRLGEGSGYRGKELSLFRIECPFCSEKGSWELVNREKKSKPNANKTLFFDTYKCGNCSSFVLIFWSAGDNLHNYRMIPWPLKLNNYPDYIPEKVGNYWLQAKRNLKEENFEAAAIMARSSLQAALRDNGAKGKKLYKEIDNFTESGKLPPLMNDWAHNLRLLGNEANHPKPEKEPVDPYDVSDIIKFLDFLLEYLYKLPKQIEKYRSRGKE
ncbi:MAG: DUF4145 domain-containing protein [Candidatus Mcinerneyibacterium aminivorans]|uniref:DUF4145 domain-containing protein n=1 Tax=Candidatus Mcinerneyibacterium aminivorans TaxID=2703815 RepID=A0A5D0MGE6_9BACT|nr:MAG: DUF4145 domain-containing protein [Candidatus Mcinerneyibacterium aminivorans]